MRLGAGLATLAALPLGVEVASARQALEPPFDASYSLVDLGPVPGVPTPYGGITLLPGDPYTLLIGGAANTEPGMIYAIGVERECGRITRFVGEATLYAEGAYNDGGLVFHPTGVLFLMQFPVNGFAQIGVGSSTIDKQIDLTPPGITSSVGACQFVPVGFPGAGRFKIASYSSSEWYDVSIAPDGMGLFDVVGVGPPIQLSGGPEGIVYVPAGSPEFPNASILVSEWGAGQVQAYGVDSNGDPDPSSVRLFISNLSGAEGAHVDPLSGDFLFSTFGGGDRVIVVRGFTLPCPGDGNGDLRVDFIDLNLVLGFFGVSGMNVPGDVNQDCVVDFLDLNLVLSEFGAVCLAE